MSAIEIPGLDAERAELLTGISIGNFIYLGYKTPTDYEGSDGGDGESDGEGDEDFDQDGDDQEEDDAQDENNNPQAVTDTTAQSTNATATATTVASDVSALATNNTTENQDNAKAAMEEEEEEEEEDAIMSDAPAPDDEETAEADDEITDIVKLEDDAQNPDHIGLYYVVSVETATDGESTKVTDVKLLKLDYEYGASNIDLDHTYRIFGAELSYTPGNGGCQHADCESLVLLSDLVADNGCRDSFVLNPSSHTVKELLQEFECPAECDEGFLTTDIVLADYLPVSIFASPAAHLDHLVPCPCCMGTAITMEWENTFAMRSLIDIGTIVELIGRLNPIRRSLGMSFHQFDERMWGYGEFHDMMEEDDHGGHNPNGGFHYYDDALDTQAAPLNANPVSAEVIAALPRKAFDGADDEECLVCQETFKKDQQVVELKCGHIFCDQTCIELWLKQSDTCPGCRAKVN